MLAYGLSQELHGRATRGVPGWHEPFPVLSLLLSGFAQSGDGRVSLQCVQPSPGAAGHTLMCPPFASCASLACLPSPCSAWQVSAAEPKDCQGVLDSVCKACKEVEKVILSGAGEEERGKRSDAMRICFIPLRKTKHLCNDLMTLEIFFNLNDSVIL